jgi:hypothetical protein
MFIFNCLTIVVLFGKYLLIQGEIFHVENYGAYPDDNIDDTKAIQYAVGAAIRSGLNDTVIFGYGFYNISSTITVINAINLTIQGQGIDQTFLIGNQPIRMFSIQYCEGLIITSLSIDFDPIPFTAGYVLNVTDTYLDIRIQPPHRPDVGQQIQYILRFDPVDMRIAYGPNTYDIYQNPPANASKTSLVSTNILRLPLLLPSQFVVGDAVIARYNQANDAIFAYNSTDFTIQSLKLYSSWAMGVVTQRIRRLNIINFHVLPRPGRWLSTTSDCMHLVSSQEFVNVIDSKCQMQGDDGLNVLTSYAIVSGIINSTSLYLTTLSGTSPYTEVGCHIEFSSYDQPFTIHGSGLIESITDFNSTTRLVTFTNPVNASFNDWVINGDTPALTIRNFTVERNRARGVLLETHNVDIRNSVFNRTSAPAVLMQPSLYWHEGPPGRNITLANNLYINCNEGIGRMSGTIAIYPDPIQLVPVIDDIRIQSSTFYFGNFVQNLIQSENANNLFFSDNYIAVNSSSPLIFLCNSRNITASNNTVLNIQTKPEQYYTFEQHNPCQMNLSSLIDLPPSAFNSSFPPPVTLT